MTAQSSAGKSRFSTYFLHKLRHLRPLTILNAIFCFFSYPFAGFTVYMFVDNVKKLSIYEDSSQISQSALAIMEANVTAWGGMALMGIIIMSMCLFAIFLMGFFFPFSGLRYLHRKKYVDMDYSLPISSNERFFGDMLSGALSYFIPHLISIGIGIVFLNLTANCVATDIEADIGMVVSFVSEFMWIGLLMCFLFYTSNIFLMSLSGKSVTTFISPLVINAAIPLAINAVVTLSNNFYGAVTSLDNGVITNPAFISTSPAGIYVAALIGLVEALGAVSATSTLTLPYFSNLTFIITIVLSLAYLAASYFLMKYRRTERVGSPYVFRGVQIAIPAIATFTIVTIYSQGIFTGAGSSGLALILGGGVGSIALVVSTIIITFIAHIIIELISGNGFKKFHFSFLRYVIALAGSFLICWIFSISSGLGQEYYIPSASNIKESTVVITKDYDEFEIKNNHELSVELHSLALSEHYLPEEYEEEDILNSIFSDSTSGDYETVSIQYRLSNGSTVSRLYPLDDETAEAMLKSVIEGGYYKQQYTEILEAIKAIPENRLETDISIYSSENGYLNYGNQTINATALVNALLKDADNLTYENTTLATDYDTATANITIEDTDGYISRSRFTVTITREHTNTLAYLESLGFGTNYIIPLISPAFAVRVPSDVVLENYYWYDSYDFIEKYDTYIFDGNNEYFIKMANVSSEGYDYYYDDVTKDEYIIALIYVNSYDLSTIARYIPFEYNYDFNEILSDMDTATVPEAEEKLLSIIGDNFVDDWTEI